MDKKNPEFEKYYEHLDHQDWNTIIVKKKSQDKGNEIKKKSSGDIISKKIEKKVQEDDLKHKKIPNDLKQIIIQGRCSNKMSQKQLAQKCNFPLQVISDIESGKAIYNHVQINKIKRILKIN